MSEAWVLLLIAASSATAAGYSWARVHHWRCQLGRHHHR